MQKSTLIPIVLLSMLLLLIISGCDPLKNPVSIEGRLSSLANHLSNDRPNAPADFEVGSSGYNGIDAGITAWPASTFTIDTINSSNSSSVTAVIHSTANMTKTGASGGGVSKTTNMTAVMVTNSNGDYVIRSITSDWVGLVY